MSLWESQDAALATGGKILFLGVQMAFRSTLGLFKRVIYLLP